MATTTSPNPTVSTPEQEEVSPLRWLMVGFAFFATILNYLDRQVLSMVKTAPDFQHLVVVDARSYGYITAAFMLAYAIMNGLSGPFIDYVGTRIGYACCMLWWSVAGILNIFARGAFSLGFFQCLLGAGEAGNWPAAAKMVTEWFPARERALASGIFNSGASVGSIVSTPIIAWLVLKWGWQCGFLVMGFLGLLWLVAWWLVYRSPKKGVQTQVKRIPVPVGRLISTRFVAFFTLSKVFMDPVWYFFVFWFPTYLTDVFHFSLKDIGWKGWIPYFTAAVGNIAGGLLTRLLIGSGMPLPTARKVSVSVFAVLMVSSIPAVLSHDAWVAIGLISVATFGYTGYTANTLAFPGDVFPKNMVGSVWGLGSVGSGLGGMFFMWLSGQLINTYGYKPVFIGYGIAPLIALTIILFFLGPLKPNPKFQETAPATA